MAWVDFTTLNLDYAKAHHCQSNPENQYCLTDLTNLEKLRTGFFHVQPEAIGIPELKDIGQQVYGSMVQVVKFAINGAYLVFYPYNGNYPPLYRKISAGNTVSQWKKFSLIADSD